MYTIVTILTTQIHLFTSLHGPMVATPSESQNLAAQTVTTGSLGTVDGVSMILRILTAITSFQVHSTLLDHLKATTFKWSTAQN